MKRTLKANRTVTDRKSWDMSWEWIAAGRVLLLLTAVLILLMPCTEYFWHFDRFLRGGQDLELGLLAIVSMLCLALLLTQHCKKGIASLLVIRRWLSCLVRPADSAAARWFYGPVAAACSASWPGAISARYSLPLQV